MTRPDFPSPDILGIPNTPRNTQIINYLFRGINTHINSDTPNGVAKIVKPIQNERMLPLFVANLWENPSFKKVMTALDFTLRDGYFNSETFSFYNKFPPILIITGFDHFLKVNQNKIKIGDSRDHLLQVLTLAEKYSMASLISFESSTFNQVIELARKNYWSHELLLNHAVIGVVK